MRTTLYKLDASGKIREWVAYIESRNREHTVYIRHGLECGEKQFERLVYDTLELAKTELNRRVDNQINRKGYTPTIPISRPFRPMLAQVYKPGKVVLPDEIIVQPKLNGHRCLASSKWMMSRQGTYFQCLPHIQAALKELPPDIVLDGELYCHGVPIQTIESWCTRNFEHSDSHKISYHVFDIADETIPCVTRIEELSNIVMNLNQKAIQFVTTIEMHNAGLTAAFETALKNGFEGCMIRIPGSYYEHNVRSHGLLKYKPKQTKWFKITDIIPCKKRPLHGKACCVTDDGKHFKCNFSYPAFIKIQILNEKSKYIGKKLLVEFIDYSEDGIPTHLSGKEIR